MSKNLSTDNSLGLPELNHLKLIIPRIQPLSITNSHLKTLGKILIKRDSTTKISPLELELMMEQKVMQTRPLEIELIGAN